MAQLGESLVVDCDHRSWLRGLPKCELHLHLEGTIEPETLVVLSRQHDAVPFTLDEARRLYQYDNFAGFLDAFFEVTERLRSPEDYALVANELVKRLASEGVVHAEVYVSLGNILRHKPLLSVDEVMAQLHEVSCIAHIESQLSLFWISDIVRNHGPEHAEHVLDETLRLRELYSSLLGIGIGGDEVNYPAKAFWEVFHRAKAAGLRTTAHAGEATPPSAIGDAISIGAERIGHALRLMEDPTLIASLQCSQLPLEICITSNLRTRCCRSLEDHPLRRYFDAGVMVTLNSDDPAMFETTLLGEYEIAQTAFRFTQAEMKTLACNSFASSFLEPEQKQHWIETCTTYMG